MPLNLPTRTEIIDQSRTDVKAELPESDPFKETGVINAELVANGGRVREVYDLLDKISKNTFVTTADEETTLERGAEEGVDLNEATGSSGAIVFTGLAGSLIPQGTELTNSDSQKFNTLTSLTLGNISIGVSQVTRSGSLVTVQTVDTHGFATGQDITIAGAVEIEYNGTFSITVVATDSFTYLLQTTPTTPATGTITASYMGGTVNASSESTGQNTNVISGGQLALTSPLAGVDDNAIVGFLGLDGGTDVETPSEYKERVLFKKRNPVTNFNNAQIEIEAKKIEGVTRVFIYNPTDVPKSETLISLIASNGFVTAKFNSDHNLLTGSKFIISGANETGFNGEFRGIVISPTEISYFVSGLNVTATGTVNINYEAIQIGQVAIYFVRDNDANIIPSAQEVQDVKDQIITIMPADTLEEDVIVRSPTSLNQNPIISNLVPDNSSIRDSIQINLDDLFISTSLGGTITEVAYNTAIQTSFDSETGQQVQSFNIDLSGDLVADFDEILILQSVSYA